MNMMNEWLERTNLWTFSYLGLIPIAILIWIFYRLFFVNHRNRKVAPKEATPVQVLNQKLARGEITEEEYRRKRRLIEKR